MTSQMYQGKAEVRKLYGVTLSEAINEGVQMATLIVICLAAVLVWYLF